MGALFSEYADTEGPKVITEIGEELPAGSVLLEDLTVNAIAYYGFYIPLGELAILSGHVSVVVTRRLHLLSLGVAL